MTSKMPRTLHTSSSMRHSKLPITAKEPPMKRSSFLQVLILGLGASAGWSCKTSGDPAPAGSSQAATAPAAAEAPKSVELLNVSYDPTRELWRDMNERFTASYKKEAGVDVTIKQS